MVIGLGFFALLNSFWLAPAYSVGDGWVSGNVAWFVDGTAAALLLAGLERAWELAVPALVVPG